MYLRYLCGRLSVRVNIFERRGAGRGGQGSGGWWSGGQGGEGNGALDKGRANTETHACRVKD